MLEKYTRNCSERYIHCVFDSQTLSISQHLQLRMGRFCWCKFYCPHALADGNQCTQIREMLSFSSTVLSTLSLYTVYLIHKHPVVNVINVSNKLTKKITSFFCRSEIFTVRQETNFSFAAHMTGSGNQLYGIAQ